MRKWAIIAARSFLGLVFFVSGINGFLRFMPDPPLPDQGVVFMQALAATGYMLPLLKIVETIAGAMLLLGWLTPLALILLAPVLVNIAAFHLVLAPAGLPMTVVLVGLAGLLAWHGREAYRPLFASSRRQQAESRAQQSPSASPATD